MIEVGDWVGGDVRESACHEHDETQNAQSAPEESEREARPPESAIQGEKVDNPQDEDGRVQAILYYARRPDLGKPHRFYCGFHRFHPHGSKAHYSEDDNEEDAAQDAGQTTPSQNAFLLRHLL